jgi:hypothetical protein
MIHQPAPNRKGGWGSKQSERMCLRNAGWSDLTGAKARGEGRCKPLTGLRRDACQPRQGLLSKFAERLSAGVSKYVRPRGSVQDCRRAG